MANIHTVLDAIIENGTSGKHVSVQVVDKREYETVRTRLVTLWASRRDIILACGDDTDPLVELSLCGNFHATSNTASFYLGKPRRKLAKSYSFSISSPEDPHDNVSVVSHDSCASGGSTIAPSTIPTTSLTAEPANDDTIVTPKLAE